MSSASLCLVDCTPDQDPAKSQVDPLGLEGVPFIPYVEHSYMESPMSREGDGYSAADYVTADAEGARNGEEEIPPGYACAIKTGEPNRGFYNHAGDYFVYATAQHQCRRGVGVTHQEAGTTLSRYLDGGYRNLDSDYTVAEGGGKMREMYVDYDCNHNRVLTYRNLAYGYSVVRNRGYFMQEERYRNWSC